MNDAGRFNLLTEKWIPVLRTNGRAERVGVLTALREAGKIRQIAASNPLDNVALLRFLLAVMLWCRPEMSEADRVSLEGAAGVPGGWLTALLEHEMAFDLLGNGDRFYQDPSLKGQSIRPIADLLVEFPGADSVNHMQHIRHDSCVFCPACCVLGMLRLSVWASANRFYPASVNPGSAAYAVVQGRNLLSTLIENRPKQELPTGPAPWLSNTPPDSPGTIANLAWRPRRLWLNVSTTAGLCTNCGCSGVTIASVCNEGGWPTPTTAGKIKKFWADDPHLLSDDEPISLPGLGTSVASHSSRFWKDALRLRNDRTGKAVAIGPVVNKFIFQDAVSVSIPPCEAQSHALLADECNRKIRDLLRRVTPNPDRQHPEFASMLALMTAHTEVRIRDCLKEPDQIADRSAWLYDMYSPVVEGTVAATTRGSHLNKRMISYLATAALKAAIKKLASQPSGTVVGEAKKRSRKQKGGDT
ncbi:MAG: type I-E CRISPR-associated protein Cse1/CasA [Phycisphaeraceae bacterium]|nr:type I-E CRISPR-associated protein Cse1/CasA [Phycisphaeraceae bacterium]